MPAPPPTRIGEERPTMPAAAARRSSRKPWLAIAGVAALAAVVGVTLVMPGVQQRHKEKYSSQQSASTTTAGTVPMVVVAPEAVGTASTSSGAPPPVAADGDKALDTAAAAAAAAAPSQPTAAATVTTKPKATASSLWSSLSDTLVNNKQQQQQNAVEVDAGFLAIPDCTPSNATELELLVEESSCRVITLLPSTTYVIDHYITITRPVTIIGRPLGIPTIDGHLTFRTFMVEPGGRLDLRYVRLYRGRARPIIPDLLYVVQGAIMYVRRGGQASMTGCHVTIHPSTRYTNVGISRNLRATTLILGGGVYMEGGLFRATGCLYTTRRPGIIFRETWFLGNEFLVLTGEVFITGCIFSSVSIFTDSLGIGGFVFNVAGTVAYTGCIFNANAMFLHSSGMGYLIFNGGGLSILTGCINNLQLGFAIFFGGGLGVWNGGGVTTMTGMIANVESIMSAGAGLGFQAGCGGGVVIRTGIIQSIHGAGAFGCGVGHSQYVGAGVIVFTNIMLTRTTSLVAFYGTGGYLYIGAGSATITNTIVGVVTGIGISAAAGGGTMLLAGWMVRTNNLVVGQSLIVAIIGQGTDLMVASGGAVLTNNRFVTRRPALIYVTKGTYGIWIAGNPVFFRPGGADKSIVATKKGQWRGSLNITAGQPKNRAKFEKLSWRFIPRPIKLKKGETKTPNSIPGRDAPAPTPPPTVPVLPNAAYYLGVPFFGARRRLQRKEEKAARRQQQHHRMLQAKASSEEEEENAAAARQQPASPVMSLPSSQKISQAIGQYLTLDESVATLASSYAAIFGGDPNAVPVEMESVREEDENEADELAALQLFQQEGGSDTHNSFIYVGDEGGGLESCQACDVQQASFDGPGAGKCVMQETCKDEEEEEDGPGSGLLKQMWVTGAGQDPANTSLAILDLHVSTTAPSSSSAAVDPVVVLSALNETIAALGLSPRHHLRVVAVTPDPLLDTYEEISTGVDRKVRHRRALQNAPGMIVGEEEEEEEDVLAFRAYMVSDWANVTHALSRGLAANTRMLTQALQQRGVGVERVQVLKAETLFVPGTGTGVLSMPSSSSSPSSLAASLLGAAAGNEGDFATLSGWEDDGIPSALLYTSFVSAPFRNGTSSDAQEEEEEENESALVHQATAGQAYSLILHSFPPVQLLTIRLVPEEGAGLTLALVPSTAGEGVVGGGGGGRGQKWVWRPNALVAPGEYFIEVTSQKNDAFAYSQAFTFV